MNSCYPVGTCSEMCPDEEIIRRQKDNRLHVLELSPDGIRTLCLYVNRKYVIKEFCRSAAGKNINVKTLRTRVALLRTVNYLLRDIISVKTMPWNIVYDFITDRLRAVRQDMIVQNFPRTYTISLLQPMVKFYAYSAYRLCQEPISKFEPVLNNTHLQECLKRLLCTYDELDVIRKKSTELEPIKDDHNLLYQNCRPLMESLYLVINLGNTTAMERFLTLPNMWKTNLVQKCFKMSVDHWNGNFVRVCRAIATLPTLLAACAVLHLPIIREKALACMSIAYSSKNTNFPAKTLEELLLYNNMEDVINDCKFYDIEVNQQNICFSKDGFYSSMPQPPAPTHIQFVDNLFEKHSIMYYILEDNFEAWVNNDGSLL